MSNFTNPPKTVQYVVATAGSTVTATADVRYLILNPAGTLATLTVVLPATPVDGQDFTVTTTKELSALTITGTIVGTLTSLPANGSLTFVYSATAAKWFLVGGLAMHTRVAAKAALPTAATDSAGLVYVPDETGGATLAFCDGTNWRRVADRAVVS